MSGKATPEQLADLIAERIDIDVDALADRLAVRLRDEWVSPAEAARRYGHTARWWRDRADELGVRDGDGPRPRIRLSVARIEQAHRRAA